MNAKKATFKVLELLDHGDTFTGFTLRAMARLDAPKMHYPATYLRYMREYRDINGVCIPCISKSKSMYQMGEKQ